MDPFIMLDYNAKYTVPLSSNPKGVDAQPHHGFKTVAIAYETGFAHRDSSAGGVIGEGDLQYTVHSK